MRIRLYDPHPGLSGCPLPLPAEVKTAAEELDGTTIELDDAIDRIQIAVKDNKYRVVKIEPQYVEGSGFISLEVERKEDAEGTKHFWRVIRFEEAKKEKEYWQ